MPIPPIPLDPREIGSLAVALHKPLGRVEVVASAVGALVAGFVMLSPTTVGTPVLVRAVIAVMLFVSSATAIALIFVPRRLLAAWEAFAWIGRWEVDRWDDVGGGRLPRSVDAARRWLEGHPSADDLQPQRVELLVWTKAFDDARAVVETMPETTAWDRFERSLLDDFVTWSAGGMSDLGAVQGAADAIDDPEDRLRAEAMIAVARAKRRLGTAHDALEPLVAFRERLVDRSDAAGLAREDLAPFLIRLFTVIGIVVVVVLTAIATLAVG